MTNTIYGKKIFSKNGIELSCFKNNKPMFSLYAPDKDAERICNSLNINQPSFVITTGFGCTNHIETLLKNSFVKKILIIEYYYDDFTNNENKFKLFTNNEYKNKIFFCTINDIYEKLLETYLPCLDGKIFFLPIRTWMDYDQNSSYWIYENINKGIKKITEDFSVQSHFGKIWLQNFCKNLYDLYKHPSNFIQLKLNHPKHPALIVAAGPSLDSYIDYIKNNQEKITIIAVDTAYKILIKNNIVPDFFVTLDGQLISYEHSFFIDSRTTVVADFCCNNKIIRKALKNNCKIIYFNNGHPLSYFAKSIFSKYNIIFPDINSGNGTVTSAALDFGKYLSFKEIILIGADFSYCNGKTYAKGSYLEEKFLFQQNILNSYENQFLALMFRTELKQINNVFTTEILTSYKNAVNNYIKANNHIKFYCNNTNILTETKDIYLLKLHFPKTKIEFSNIDKIPYNIFPLLDEEISKNELSPLLYPLLAWFIRKYPAETEKNRIYNANYLAKEYFSFYNKLL